MNKHISNFLLSLTIILWLTLGLSPTAYAAYKSGDFWEVKEALDPVSYLDADGSEKTCTDYTVVTSSTTTWNEGWYVVNSDVSINETIKLNGNVNLILCDDAKLNVNVDGASASYSSNAAIDIHNELANFTIYAQSTGEDMGELNVKAPNDVALFGIHSNITFNGGKVMMEGRYASFIDYSTLTVNGGDITFTGTSDGIFSNKCQMYVDGGNVTVIGKYGIFSNECQMYVDGGKLTVIGEYGIDSYESQMYVDGGNVTVIGDYQAIYDDCLVMNSIPGTGWTNTDGTEGQTAIKVSTEGQNLSNFNFKKVQFPAAHTHNFTYSADGATITATCSVENCTLTDNKVSLTIVAPEMTVSGTTKNANATLTGLEEFNSATELAVAAADIMYVNRDKGNETSTAPTSAGQYTAKITVKGQTASVDYEILAPVTLTVRSNKEDWGTVEVEGLGNEVIWKDMDNSGTSTYSQDGVMLTPSNDFAHFENYFYPEGDNTFTSTLGNFTKIEIICTSGNIDGWTKESAGMDLYKLTWTGDAESITLHNDVSGIQSIKFVFGGTGVSGITANEDGTYTVNPGTEVTIKATPAEGFHLASWSNGAEVNEDGTQKIKVTEDINIVANFTSPFAIAMDTDHKAEAANSEVQNGFEINTYGYCNDNSYRLKYYLLSGEPDQYKVEFDDNRFFDTDWTELATVGPEGTIDLEIPADIPTGDYSMKVTFRNSNYTTFDSEPIEVSFHVNLPETYTVPLYDNVIALVNTCECFTDVQWYHRDNSNADWQAISGATGYYYRQVGGLTGEYFVSAKMNGVSTYTCPQTDVKTLYGAPKKVAKVHVSPNPIENNATVSIEDTENLEHSLRIINVMGNVIEVRTFNGNSTSIDMGAYPTGSYMINVDGIGVKVIRK